MLVVQVFCKLGNALSVCFGFETEASALKESPEFLVIGDDTVMNDGKLPLRIRPVCLSALPSLFMDCVLTYEDGNSVYLADRVWPILCVQCLRVSRKLWSYRHWTP